MARRGAQTRFFGLKVGDQLMKRHRRGQAYIVITDIWLDPVSGQFEKFKGRMAGFRHVNQSTGGLFRRKYALPVCQFASKGYKPADIDALVHFRARRDALQSGGVVELEKRR